MQAERTASKDAVKVSLYMKHFFCAYRILPRDAFPFEWLETTKEFKVRCNDTTGEEIIFPASPELLKAIHNCENVNFPNQGYHLPSDWGFSGFISSAVYYVIQKSPVAEINDFFGPLFGILGATLRLDSSRSITGVRWMHLSDNHWSCIMRDWTYDRDMPENSRGFLLKAELLAVSSIFFRQMNEMIWNCETYRYRARPRYKEGILTTVKATVATFICGEVRIVQATLNPSEPYPTLAFTLRAVIKLNKENYSKEAAYEVLKWILCPPEAPKVLATREKK
ncbi:uncharacterized protein GIQ15_05915 [Arthroderma uncinatum]|uniref:uncharacterized protein n=1 Tax=Arthroderma uncinatum TaxID=74035 RepID=UPI00144AEAD7|nr:uncharacterized protein GIQ15_05915 [Arthroderma uncinatum]KAF3480568.1 hypothetical protein GIQ15_05915 [Arthroderma uncinatum]